MKKTFTHVVKRALPLVIFSFLLSCNSSRRSIGIEEGWELITERKVNFVKDKDEITINNRIPYTAVRFKVEDKDVHINELKIYFDNGDKLEPKMDDAIAADEFSRVIDLGREGRYVDHIEFKYRSTGSLLKGRANLLVLGKKYYREY
jgi:hypothetical protein